MSLWTLEKWMRADPNPAKTIQMIKDKIARKKNLSKNNPIKLMKMEMSREEWDAYWREKKSAEPHYLHTGGWTRKESGQHDMKHIAMIPQCVYNHNPEYWGDIIKSRQFYKHPEFLVSNPKPQWRKSLR
jgi:hypothetical protein